MFTTETDTPRAADTLVRHAADRLIDVEHSPDSLGGLGELAITVDGTDGQHHTAVWAFMHDGHGGGHWEHQGPELLLEIHALLD